MRARTVPTRVARQAMSSARLVASWVSSLQLWRTRSRRRWRGFESRGLLIPVTPTGLQSWLWPELPKRGDEKTGKGERGVGTGGSENALASEHEHGLGRGSGLGLGGSEGAVASEDAETG